ncbi:putative double-stranded RNA-binding domain-containing protein [Helianthus annuus]|uniref:Double-stranded RNA-binding domain-containing protein n=1 Tax=Helianthus annuus TaxID=4232 RepID=A0A251RVZ9_HELAN|nr:ribonuclease 3-like protein 1 [Helianthus annuus]KAF5758095.1 putative double-stranded RNA-binding domain-containing protein [Helianthus annuus]
MTLLPSSAGGDDDNRTPPPSLDSQPITSSSSSTSIPPGPVKLTARSCLYELCAQSHWNRPVFDCCNQQGPDNQRSFTYKASIEMKEGSESTLAIECIGKPQFSKKTAADSAAEGILWYLVHLGYPKTPNRRKK